MSMQENILIVCSINDTTHFEPIFSPNKEFWPSYICVYLYYELELCNMEFKRLILYCRKPI